MVNRFIILFFLFSSISTSVFSLSIEMEGGTAHFLYAEVGNNNKDNLYKISALTGGISIGQERLNGYIGAQIPIYLNFEDALGRNGQNYLNDFMYFGLNSSFSYSFFWEEEAQLRLLLAMNYFMFRDHLDINNPEYDFLTIGPGFGITLGKAFNEHFLLLFDNDIYVNFPMFLRTDKKYLWAFSFSFDFNLVFRF